MHSNQSIQCAVSLVLAALVPIEFNSASSQRDIIETQLAFAPDGKTLASGGGDRVHNRLTGSGVSLWDLETMRVRVTLPVQGVPACIAYSPDGTSLAIGFEQNDGKNAVGKVKLFHADTGKERFTIDGGRIITGVSFSPLGNALAIANVKSTGQQVIDIWELEGHRLRHTLSDIIRQRLLGFFFTTNQALVLGTPMQLDLWNVEDASRLVTEKLDPTRRTGTWAFAYWPQANLIVCGTGPVTDSLPGELRFLDGTTAKARRSIKVADRGGGVRAVAVSPDGSMFAVTTAPFLRPEDLGNPYDVELLVLDSNTGQVLRNLGKHQYSLHPLLFSPDGKMLCGADAFGTIRIWQTGAWKETKLQVP